MASLLGKTRRDQRRHSANSIKTSGSQQARIVEKLGWLKEFQTDLRLWRQYRMLIGETLTMANRQGVFLGATAQLRQRLSACGVVDEDAVIEFREQIVACYEENERQLKKLDRADLRFPSSTEVLESGFGSFKVLQGNHGRGTFTSLLAVFAAQFDNCTRDKIRDRFARVTNKDVKVWLTLSMTIRSSTYGCPPMSPVSSPVTTKRTRSLCQTFP